MALAFLIAIPGYELMLVAMTYVVVTRFHLAAHGKPISLLFVWDLRLESSHLVRFDSAPMPNTSHRM
jgi:hypothetical protein